MKYISELLKPRGLVEVFATVGAPKLVNLVGYQPNKMGIPKYLGGDLDFSSCKVVIGHQKSENIILDVGKDKVIESFTTGFINTIARMAIGDRGALPSDPTTPKVPTSDLPGLYNEVYRDDVDAVILDIGTPEKHEVKFIKTFSAVDIPLTSFSNQATPIINEVSLITADLLVGNPLPRLPVSAPNVPDADEEFFSLRTFKSVPFEAANEISITIRYTIFID